MSPESKIQVRLNPENPQDNCITTYLAKVKSEAESKGLRFNESQTVRDLLTAGIKALSGATITAPDSQASHSIANNDELVRLIRQTISESGGQPVNPQQVKEIVVTSIQEMIPQIQKEIVSQMLSGLQPAAAAASNAATETDASEVTQQLTAELAADLINSQF
jgi:hypothetical protein